MGNRYKPFCPLPCRTTLHVNNTIFCCKKTIDRGKGVFGVAIGSSELYEWLDDNHGVAAYPLEYVNRPDVIAQIDNMVSINSCVSVDLYGQVSSESFGARQISGTGGQLDFLIG